jgi:hypothetical protein
VERALLLVFFVAEVELNQLYFFLFEQFLPFGEEVAQCLLEILVFFFQIDEL